LELHLHINPEYMEPAKEEEIRPVEGEEEEGE
jgi:hypothetical protein